MQKTKILIAAVALVAIAAVVVGVASAQIAASQTPAPGTTVAPVQSNGFWGWMGNCWRFWTGQGVGTQSVVPPVGAAQPYIPTQPSTTSAPYPVQGGYGYGMGRGMMRFW